MKTSTYYKKLNYKMVFEFDPEESVYFVKFPELPGCVAEGDTPREALQNAISVKNEWIDEALEAGWSIPEPEVPPQTTGRITLRLPHYLHEKVIDRADKEGTSLNQLILAYISEGLERTASKDYFERVIEIQDSAFNRIANIIEVTGLPKPQETGTRYVVLGQAGWPKIQGIQVISQATEIDDEFKNESDLYKSEVIWGTTPRSGGRK